MNDTDAIGLLVMVSPVLWTSEHAGKICTIGFADFSQDSIWVEFENEELECFSSRTLFVLKTADALTELAENKFGTLWQPLPQQLLKLAGLRSSGSTAELQAAFELVQHDPELHRLAIEMAPTRKIGR